VGPVLLTWDSVLQCVAVCCSVLQCVAVCCSATHFGLTRSQDDLLYFLIYTYTYIYSLWLQVSSTGAPCSSFWSHFGFKIEQDILTPRLGI